MQAIGIIRLFLQVSLAVTLVAVFFIAGLVLNNDTAEAAPAEYAYYIADDATGGDCPLIGSWDAATKTCTMTSSFGFSGDFYESGIKILSDGITLNGDGQQISSMSAWSTVNIGVWINGHSNVTVKNLKINETMIGIRSDGVMGNGVDPIQGNRITHNELKDCLYGIDAQGDSTFVADNSISLTAWGRGIIASEPQYYAGRGISLSGSDGHIVRNTVSGYSNDSYLGPGDLENCASLPFDGCTAGIFLDGAQSPLVNQNNVSACTIGLFWLWPAEGHIIRNTFESNILGLRTLGADTWGRVYLNNFESNAMQAWAYQDDQVSFDIPNPPLGNHWSNFDETAEGCFPGPIDGVCDAPLPIQDNHLDHYPRMEKVSNTIPLGFAPKLVLQKSGVYWASLADFDNSLLSVDFHVDSFFDVWYNLELTRVLNSGTVRTVSDISYPPGPGHPVESCDPPVPGVPPEPCMQGDVAWDFTLQYYIPPGASFFRTSISGQIQDSDGTVYQIPGRDLPPPDDG